MSTLSLSYKDRINHIEKLGFTVDDSPLQPGDSYIAERNTGPQLLTCKSVNRDKGWVVPQEQAYPFDIHECIKIKVE